MIGPPLSVGQFPAWATEEAAERVRAALRGADALSLAVSLFSRLQGEGGGIRGSSTNESGGAKSARSIVSWSVIRLRSDWGDGGRINECKLRRTWGAGGCAHPVNGEGRGMEEGGGWGGCAGMARAGRGECCGRCSRRTLGGSLSCLVPKRSLTALKDTPSDDTTAFRSYRSRPGYFPLGLPHLPQPGRPALVDTASRRWNLPAAPAARHC